MFRPLRRSLPDLWLFLCSQSSKVFLSFFIFTIFPPLLFFYSLRPQKQAGRWELLPVVCFADGALGGGGFFGLWKRIQMQKHHKTTSADFKHHYNLESFASHDKITSFSTSSSLTKLSGKTPCLPPISPIHQPASAQSWTKSFLSIYLNLQMPGSECRCEYEIAQCFAHLSDDIYDVPVFDRQLIFILCFVWKEDFTLLPPWQPVKRSQVSLIEQNHRKSEKQEGLDKEGKLDLTYINRRMCFHYARTSSTQFTSSKKCNL